MKRVIAALGAATPAAALGPSDIQRYEQARRSGAPGQRPVKARSVQADLVVLNTMLNWATRERNAGGERLLAENPLRGVRVQHEKNPRRPVATQQRFETTRAAMRRLCRDATVDAERVRWIKLELALVLAEATGRRLSSIRQLRWEDVDFEHEQIRWRADADKKGVEYVVPIPRRLALELRSLKDRLGAEASWVFPGERSPEQPMDRHLFDKWLARAEAEADLPKLAGGLWHPYRRKWATERKALSLKDVAAAGGWQDTETLLKCYQQPDRATMLAVMENGQGGAKRG